MTWIGTYASYFYAMVTMSVCKPILLINFILMRFCVSLLIQYFVFKSDYANITMLTAVPKFWTFLPIYMSVCFAKTLLSFNWLQ